jgi:TonB family protein
MDPDSNNENIKRRRSGKVLKISIAVSILFHVIGLLAIQKAFPVNWFVPLKIFEVEFIRPPVDQLKEEKEAGTDLAKVKEKEDSPEETEETISLDTQDERYSSYAAMIRERLMAHWEYPGHARENLIEGKLLLLFTLTRSGQLKEMKILDPSGFPVLDKEALRTVQTSAPFPPFPGSVTVSKLNIEAAFDYRLKKRQ